MPVIQRGPEWRTGLAVTVLVRSGWAQPPSAGRGTSRSFPEVFVLGVQEGDPFLYACVVLGKQAQTLGEGGLPMAGEFGVPAQCEPPANASRRWPSTRTRSR